MAGLHLLLLDIDGVLIDARPSYDASSIETISLYLTRVLGFAGPASGVITMEHVHALKRAGGFNNDWHLCYALLRRLLARAPQDLDVPSHDAGDGLAAALKRLAVVGPASGLHCEALVRSAGLLEYADALAAAGGGLDAVAQVCGERHAGLVLYGDDLTRDDLVTRVFQEVYLGAELLRRHHGVAPLLGEREGLWTRERPLVPREILARLADAMPIAVVTGRPGLEAELALSLAGLQGRVTALGSEDDVAVESERRRAAGIRPAHAGKPDPYLVHLVLQKAAATEGDAVFVGDLADDVLAARAASSDALPIEAIGATWGADDPAAAAGELRQAGADRVFDEPTQLLELLEH